MRKLGYYLLFILLNSVLSLLLPYLFVLFIIDIEYIRYVSGTLDPGAAAHMRGEEGMLPLFIVFTLLSTTAFLAAFIFFNRKIYRVLNTTKIKYIAVVASIFIIVLLLDLVVDPFNFMWRFRDLV